MKRTPSLSELLQSRKNSMFPIRSCENGQKLERSSTSRRQEVMGCTQARTLNTCLGTLKRKRNHMCTAELAPNTRRKISNVRYYTCKSNAQVRKLSRTLDLESISSDMDSQDSSSLCRRTQWRRSPLRTKTDSAASDMDYLKTSVDIMERKSWFSMRSKMTPIENSLTTYLPSVMSLLQPRMDEGLQGTKKKEQKRFGKIVKSKTGTVKCSKSVPLCLDAEHRALMRYWFGAYRWIYNKCVDFSKRFPHLRKNFRLGKLLVYNHSIWAQHHTWLKDIPVSSHEAAYRDFQKALESNFAKKVFNPSHKFSFRFKSRKAKSQSIQFRTRDIIGSGKKGRPPRPFPTKWGKSTLVSKEPLVYHDASTRIVYKSGINKYYSTITRDVQCENQALAPANIVALDPGVCTFQASYAIDGSVTMYGHECRKVLNGLHLRIDHINSDIANIKKRGKYTSKQKSQKIKNRMKKKAWLYQRMEDLTTTMHYETIKSLRKYPVILLP
eukprot:NODE_221_length_13987_cov_0.244888.p2 type:complete len:496 gc:universal NODE_221_length_13987_cov_0.244888:10141-11628(+)